MARTKKSTELMRLMNEAIAREMQVSIQYMWQYVLWYGVKGFAVKDEGGAIIFYNKIIKVAEKAGDVVSMDLFKKILADEEDHHDTFSGLLEEI